MSKKVKRRKIRISGEAKSTKMLAGYMMPIKQVKSLPLLGQEPLVDHVGNGDCK